MMKMKRSPSGRVFLAVILVSIIIEIMAIMVSSVNAQSQPTPSDDEVNSVAGQIYCPVCENVTLDVCSTTACAQWRELIREKLAQGMTSDQIKDYFVQQYGDRVLAVPPRTGLNWTLYLLPIFIFVVALLLTVRHILSSRSPRPPKEKERSDE
jgi:cytochrome c-type biogenesis protein CcmH